jgi:hypothetical protein
MSSVDRPEDSGEAPVTGPRIVRSRSDEQRIELTLSFGELTLVHRSLEAVKTLGAFEPQDELLNDTIDLVDLALNEAA